MRIAISNNISMLIKKFTLPSQPLFTKNNGCDVIKKNLQKSSNSTVTFTHSSTKAPIDLGCKIPPSKLKDIYARKRSDSFASKHGKFLQELNSRLAAGRPAAIKKPLVATPAPAPITLSTFTLPAPVKPGNMGMPPPPPPMPPASYVPPRIIQTNTVNSAPVVREKKSIKPETTPKYNSVMDELKKRFEASSHRVQEASH